MMTDLVAVRGLEKTSPAFREKLVRLMSDRGLNPDFVATSISFETMGTFSPSIRSPNSSAVGLIQFIEPTAHQLGTTTAALGAMSAEDQLDYVAKDFDRVMSAVGKPATLGDHYLMIFAPSAVGKPEDAEVYSAERTPAAYAANRGLDRNHDGVITVADATAGVKALYAQGQTRPRIAADLSATPNGFGSVTDGDHPVANGLGFGLLAFGVYRAVKAVR